MFLCMLSRSKFLKMNDNNRMRKRNGVDTSLVQWVRRCHAPANR